MFWITYKTFGTQWIIVTCMLPKWVTLVNMVTARN